MPLADATVHGEGEEEMSEALSAKRRTATLLIIAGVILAIVGTCGVAVSRLKFGDPKGPTEIGWNSDRSPSDAEFVDLARDLMIQHGRDLSNLNVESVAKQQDGSTLISFRNLKNGWEWFVAIHREGSRWVGETRHGT